jgi:hypothetical protein
MRLELIFPILKFRVAHFLTDKEWALREVHGGAKPAKHRAKQGHALINISRYFIIPI